MKKILGLFIAFAVLLSSFPLSAVAQNFNDEYTNDEIESIYLKYIQNESLLDKLFGDDTAVGYWRIVNGMEESVVSKWAIDTASKIIGEYPDQQDYAEILANLIMMQSGNLAEQIENQSSFDDLKDGLDYTMDIVDIATAFIGGTQLFEDVSAIIDAATGGTEVIIDNLEYAKYYETSIRDYSQSKMFLETISQYAENQDLKSVATSLIKANDVLLEERLKYLADTTESLANYEASFFVKNLSFELLKSSEFYQSDDTVRWFVDCGSKLANSILSILSAGQFTFNMMMLAGNIGFGTANTFNRYQEMKIVADVASAIVQANRNLSIPSNSDEANTLQIIQTKCDYYKMLLTIHARGEYLVYQLLINDAGILSDCKALFDHFKDPDETTESWYNGQTSIILKYFDILSNMFVVDKKDSVVSESAIIPEDAVEFNNHYYYAYNLAAVTTWEEAKQFCEDQGGYLATITSQEENDFVYSQLKNHFHYTSAYFGFTDRNKEGNWVWDNGEVSSYTNWHMQEPNGENSNENYGMYYYKYPDGSWNDGDFGGKTLNGGTVFICEWGEYEVGSDQNIVSDNGSDIWEELPSEFIFSSGAGAWQTEMKLNDDGTFTGQYYDSEIGVFEEAYPNGTVYISNFTGKFTEPTQVSEFIYSTKLEYLNVEGTVGDEWIEDGILYQNTDPYGFDDADEFLIYLPGCPLQNVDDEFLSWSFIDTQIRNTMPKGVYGIYNVSGKESFVGQEDNSIWQNTYTYSFNSNYSELQPSYSSVSHLNFWPESGAAVLSLGFEWNSDSQTVFVASDFNGTGDYNISLDFSEDFSLVVITINSLSHFNLTPWGGTEDGWLSAEYYLKK